LSKEKSDLIFNVQEKDRKIREIKVRTEQIDSEKKKLDEALRKNTNAEEELRQELERIVEEVKKKIDQKQTEDTKNTQIQMEIRQIKEKMQEIKSQKDIYKKSYLTLVKDCKRKEN
jgi:uncharacterized phage infection (PIP) family protein YhgE